MVFEANVHGQHGGSWCGQHYSLDISMCPMSSDFIKQLRGGSRIFRRGGLRMQRK